LLSQQLEAVRAQTCPPTQILIWHNHADGYPLPPLDLRINEIVISSSVNLGVWARYTALNLLNADYYAVADDDSLPGERFFENCLSCLKELPAYSIVGTCGVLFPSGSRDDRAYVGWKNPMNATVHADIVAHFSMFDRALARDFVPCFDYGTSCGEDYSICALARKRGGVVACPPHPADDKSLWGSINGFEHGSDDVALYRQPGEEERKRRVHDDLRRHGWKVATEVYQ